MTYLVLKSGYVGGSGQKIHAESDVLRQHLKVDRQPKLKMWCDTESHRVRDKGKFVFCYFLLGKTEVVMS